MPRRRKAARDDLRAVQIVRRPIVPSGAAGLAEYEVSGSAYKHQPMISVSRRRRPLNECRQVS